MTHTPEEKLADTIEELAATVETNISNMTPLKALSKCGEKVGAPGSAQYASFRKLLREEMLRMKILGEDVDLNPYTEFHGEGDSGDLEPYSVNAVSIFFNDLLNAHVTFDWYNGDGGGGNISWDIQKDVVTINGYYNIVTQEDAMTEAEF